MIIHDLFDNVLIDPFSKGARDLYIVSGYATPAMVYFHLHQCRQRFGNSIPNISMIVGMTSRDGISKAAHAGFLAISSSLPKSFICRYIYKGLPVHTKAFLWVDSKTAFIGSANYTQSGFLDKTREVVESSSSDEVSKYYKSLLVDSIVCTDPFVSKLINLTSKSLWRPESLPSGLPRPVPEEAGFDTSSMSKVVLSLLDRNGNVPDRSGLNWGQRDGRDPDQAYISIRKSECPDGFFPQRYRHLTILTDDGQSFDCHIAQADGKAIHTTDNAALGRYFRGRISVPLGDMVHRSHLDQYGRTDVDFYKIDDETYFLDFSVKH